MDVRSVHLFLFLIKKQFLRDEESIPLSSPIEVIAPSLPSDMKISGKKGKRNWSAIRLDGTALSPGPIVRDGQTFAIPGVSRITNDVSASNIPRVEPSRYLVNNWHRRNLSWSFCSPTTRLETIVTYRAFTLLVTRCTGHGSKSPKLHVGSCLRDHLQRLIPSIC